MFGYGYSFAQTSPVPVEPVDYVNPLMGTDSRIELSNEIGIPSHCAALGESNFWVPQTNKMGDGWTYQYSAEKDQGFKQTHQPSPWINDYGQFSIMPVTRKMNFDQDKRASWFSHKTERSTPYYYSVYSGRCRCNPLKLPPPTGLPNYASPSLHAIVHS